ncbi:MAG TPA: glycosyltransferase [Bacteroidales bacterium]|nr:glycosyltransferase [Bacteroidales bacterium]
MFSKGIFSSPKKEIELVSFNVPYPPNYGGVIDIYYKLKAFRKAGIKVNLHCFEYGRKASVELESLCQKVYYYKRHIAKTNLFRRRPYIVVTRSSENLVTNLLKNNNPILFEGLHSCFYLDDKRFKRRHKIVRTHNIEHDYYENLGKVEKDIFKKYYFFNESQKLYRFEKVLNFAEGIAAISIHDKNYFSRKYKHSNVKVISAFHPNEEVQINEGTGDFVLYHGSLSVGENNEAALFLIEKVFNDLDIPLVIAGNKPTKELRAAVEKYKNITLKSDVTTEELYKMVKAAQINILPTFQATGIKLKLIAALFTGRHCIVNKPMIDDTGLEELCLVKNNPDDFKNTIRQYFTIPFTKDDIEKRKKILNDSRYSNSYNINLLISMLLP